MLHLPPPRPAPPPYKTREGLLAVPQTIRSRHLGRPEVALSIVWYVFVNFWRENEQDDESEAELGLLLAGRPFALEQSHADTLVIHELGFCQKSLHVCFEITNHDVSNQDRSV